MFSVGWGRGRPCLNQDRHLVKELFRTIHLTSGKTEKYFIMFNLLASSIEYRETCLRSLRSYFLNLVNGVRKMFL